MKILPVALAAALIAVSIPQNVDAGDTFAATEISKPVLQSDFVFRKGRKEVQLLDGVFIGFGPKPLNRPAYDYELTVLRLGYMVTDVKCSGWLRGNTEFLVEGFVGPFYQGPGSILAGGSLLLRYNFVQPGSHLIPYIQTGGGALYSDGYIHREQRELGSAGEFILQSALGLICLPGGNWAVSTELGYRHISNADTAPRNIGVNSLGGMLGISYSF